MATAQDAAQFALKRLGELSSVKLQKLVYYMQAWHLVASRKPLFPGEIRAFQYGPVVYDVWRPNQGANFFAANFFDDVALGLSADEVEVVIPVLDFYGSMDTWQLVDLTHRESPWLDAWGRSNRGGSDVIAVEAMQQYYAGQLVSGARVPHLPAGAVTYVTGAEFDDLDRHLDDPDDLPGFHLALEQARRKM